MADFLGIRKKPLKVEARGLNYLYDKEYLLNRMTLVNYLYNIIIVISLKP